MTPPHATLEPLAIYMATESDTRDAIRAAGVDRAWRRASLQGASHAWHARCARDILQLSRSAYDPSVDWRDVLFAWTLRRYPRRCPVYVEQGTWCEAAQEEVGAPLAAPPVPDAWVTATVWMFDGRGGVHLRKLFTGHERLEDLGGSRRVASVALGRARDFKEFVIALEGEQIVGGLDSLIVTVDVTVGCHTTRLELDLEPWRVPRRPHAVTRSGCGLHAVWGPLWNPEVDFYSSSRWMSRRKWGPALERDLGTLHVISRGTTGVHGARCIGGACIACHCRAPSAATRLLGFHRQNAGVAQ